MKVRAYLDLSNDKDKLCLLLHKDVNHNGEGSVINTGFYDIKHRDFLEEVVKNFNNSFEALWH